MTIVTSLTGFILIVDDTPTNLVPASAHSPVLIPIARQIIVEKHGGTLEVKSDIGQNTEFWIRLPIAG